MVQPVDSQSSMISTRSAGVATEIGALAFGKGWRSWAERVVAAKTGAELETLFKEVGEVEDYRLKATMQRLLGARWAEVDPAHGALFLKHAPQGIWTLQELMTEWFLRDPVAAVKALEAHDRPGSSQVPDAVQDRLSKRNPKAALDFIRARGKYAHYPESGLKALVSAYPKELAALIIEIETERLARGERARTSSYFRLVALELAKRDPRAALAWASGLGGKIGKAAEEEVIEYWAKADPLAAAKHIKESGMKQRQLFDQELENALAGEDFDKLIALAKTRGSADRSLSRILAKQIGDGTLSFEQVYDRVSKIETNKGWVAAAPRL